MSPALTVMRSTLPRRSVVFRADRRASTCGALNRPASAGMLIPWPLLIVAIATLAAGVVPARPDPSAVMSGTSWPCLLPAKLTCRFVAAFPVTATSVRLSSASSAASIAVLTSGNGIGAVVWPSNVSVNVPPVAPVTLTCWTSFVSWSLNGPKPPELPPPAGVSSPVTSHRLLCESKSMSPATWQQAPRLFGTRRICCSLARSRCAATPPLASTNLKRESWK